MRMLNNQLKLIPEVAKFFEDQANGPHIEYNLGTKLERMAGKRVIFRTDFSKEAIALQNLRLSNRDYSTHVFQEFSNCPRERTVASIDSSCALIGETEDGSIYAGRVATVFSQKGMIQSYWRAGPIIVYVDSKVLTAEFSNNNLGRKLASLILFDRTIAERFVRMNLERRAQLQVASSLTDSIIVADGALKASILEQKESTFKKVQDTCEENANEFLGISKTTSLRLVSNAISALQAHPKSQVFYDLTSSLGVLVPLFRSGHITIAKFNANSPVFRVDFSSSNSENPAQLFADLKFNDTFFRGYPETLRLAHHLSILDSSTISSVRTFLAKKYDLIQIPSDDLRSTILGKLV